MLCSRAHLEHLEGVAVVAHGGQVGRGVAVEVLGILACGISIQNEGQGPVSTGETWESMHTR